MFPTWRLGEEERQAGFSIARLDREGGCRGSDYFLDRNSGVDAERHLSATLGVSTEVRGMHSYSFSSSMDSALGFPGAEDYLAKHIGKLSDYLTEAARRLKGDHKH